MTDIKGYIQERIREYEYIISKSSGLAKRVASHAQYDLQRILNAIIQEEK